MKNNFTLFSQLIFIAVFCFPVMAQEDAQPARQEAAEAEQEDEADNNLADEPMALPAANMDDIYKQMQSKAMDIELANLQRVFGFDDETVEKIKESLKSHLEETCRRLSRESRGTITQRLDIQFLDTIRERAAQFLDEDGKSKLEQYIATGNEIQKELDLVSVKATVGFFDDYLCLDPEQESQFIERLEKVWQSEWNYEVLTVALNGPRIRTEMLTKINEESEILQDLLNEEQLDVFNNFNDYPIGISAMLNLRVMAGGGEESSFDEDNMKEKINKLLALDLNDLATTCELTDKQIRLLKVGHKGLLGPVLKRQKELTEDGMNMNFTGKRIAELAKPVLFRCREQKVWQKSLEKVLTDEQLEKAMAKRADRLNIAKQHFASQLSMAHADTEKPLGTTFEQQAKLRDLYIAKLQLDHPADYWAMYKAMGLIERVELEAFLDEEQTTLLWDSMQKQLEMQRLNDGEEDE